MATANSDLNKRNDTTFLQLDDNSLLEIFSRLNAIDQLSISKVNDRFASIIWYLWKTVKIDLKEWTSHERCAEFIGRASPYVKHFRIADITHDFLQLITSYTFPRAQHLDLTASNRNCSSVYKLFCDQNMKEMVQMFPNIKRLELRGCFITDNFLIQFQAVQHLRLEYCHDLTDAGLRDIFHNMPLKSLDLTSGITSEHLDFLNNIKCCSTLEHIRLHERNLCRVEDVTHIITIPNLLKFSVISWRLQCEVLRAVTQDRGRSILRFRYSGSVRNVKSFFEYVSNINELEALILQDCRDALRHPAKIFSLGDISKKLQHLRSLHVTGCALENEFGVVNFVENCPNLEILDVTNTNVTQNMIDRVISILQVQKSRTKPLEIWTRGTKIKKEDTINMLNINTTSILRKFDGCVLEFTFDKIL